MHWIYRCKGSLKIIIIIIKKKTNLVPVSHFILTKKKGQIFSQSKREEHNHITISALFTLHFKNILCESNLKKIFFISLNLILRPFDSLSWNVKFKIILAKWPNFGLLLKLFHFSKHFCKMITFINFKLKFVN